MRVEYVKYCTSRAGEVQWTEAQFSKRAVQIGDNVPARKA